jgi:hypothetical protein
MRTDRKKDNTFEEIDEIVLEGVHYTPKINLADDLPSSADPTHFTQVLQPCFHNFPCLSYISILNTHL